MSQNKNNYVSSAARARLFDHVYSSGSLAGGILKSTRPNDADDWNPAGEAAISDATVEQYVNDFVEAARIVATRATNA